MDRAFPFEYGFLYKLIGTPSWNDGEDISKSIQLDSNYTYFNNSGVSAMTGHSTVNGIDHEKYFHPIGFVESKQKVVVEVMVRETESTSGHLYMSGMSFNTSTIQKEYKKISRAHIDVNIFIRNFEKVL